VAELAGWTELEEISSTGGTILAGVNQWGRRSICEYEISYDAIIPLFRSVFCFKHLEDVFWEEIEKIPVNKRSPSLSQWVAYYATPADYCRAYVAAMKGE
jgi:hypothetical protein